jgi:DNA-binding protein YbaB
MDELERLTQEFEKFQQKIKGFQQQAVNTEAMSQEITDLEAQAVSPDGTVTVVAGPGGSIKDIRFRNARRLDDTQLASTVRSTLQQAVATAARRQAAIVERHAGPGLGILDQVMEVQKDAFTAEQRPTPPPPPPQPAPPRPARPAPEPVDEGQGSVLRKGAPRRDTPQPNPPRPGQRKVMRNLGREEEY